MDWVKADILIDQFLRAPQVRSRQTKRLALAILRAFRSTTFGQW
jgi:hypothetical protein